MLAKGIHEDGCGLALEEEVNDDFLRFLAHVLEPGADQVEYFLFHQKVLLEDCSGELLSRDNLGITLTRTWNVFLPKDTLGSKTEFSPMSSYPNGI